MDYKKLTEYLVKSLAKKPDLVTVNVLENDIITIDVSISESDMGAVIGRGGLNAKAIRTLIQAASNNDQGKKTRVNIESL